MPAPVCEQSERVINGAEAMATAFELAGVKIAYTFPITPQSEVMDYFSQHSGITCVRADSEYNVLAGAEGVLWSGERCAVATASQGLILMSEVMWEVAGNRLPLVMGVFNRGLKGPGWCLGTQQNDALFMRDTGWMQFYCESAQEIFDFVLIGFRLAETMLIPTMLVGDGFYLSHEKEEVRLPSPEEVAAFVGTRQDEEMPLAATVANYSGLCPPEKYHAFYVQLHRDIVRAEAVFGDIAAEYAERFGRRYDVFETHFVEDADVVFLTAGTISGTARDVVRKLRSDGESVGLIKLHAFRPFPRTRLRELIQPHQKLVMLDRNIGAGAGGIMGLELRAAFGNPEDGCPRIFDFVTGLGGLDVTPEIVQFAYEYVRDYHGTPPYVAFLTEDGIETAA